MTFPELEQLEQADGVTSFIVLRWEEMFDEQTPDTFQPRLYNIEALLYELSQVASMAEQSSVWRKHVDAIKAELNQCLLENDVLLGLAPEYKWRLKDVGSAESINEVRCRTELALERRPKFSEIYLDTLKLALSRMPTEKGLMDRAIGNLASYAFKSGRARRDIKSMCGTGALSLSPQAIVERLYANCNQDAEEYSFIVVAKGDKSTIQAIVQKLPTVRLLKKKEYFNDGNAGRFFEINNGYSFLTGQVASRHASSISAVKQALKQTRQITDIFNFFANSSELYISDEVLIVPKDKEPEIVHWEKESRLRLAPRKDARELTRATLLNNHKGIIDDRLLNALELHGLSQSSVVPRVRLVTLWSAIECLVGAGNGDSIIDRVTDLVVPLVSWRRFQKIVKYLAISTHESRCAYGKKLSYEAFPNSTKYVVAQEDMLRMLLLPTNDPQLLDFASFMAPHPVLLHRFHTIWKTFSNAKVLNKEAEASRLRIKWHLHRIYRARNLTVHNGDEAPESPALLDTLQYYFSVVLTLILDEKAEHTSWSLDLSIASLLQRARYVQTHLVKEPRCLKIVDVLPNCEFNHAESLWAS